ncbi:MAG: hypothetical protein A3B70_07095 [Deltaproteobacteria bacterium RIFCSPHIGHO2_02_FULL_40_11]|nr:MAG: hypothetical protein A3B70_07095 [Deltaproteobacteria bacterium RIFCSPHIGHO2_02_FULL_40_11]
MKNIKILFGSFIILMLFSINAFSQISRYALLTQIQYVLDAQDTLRERYPSFDDLGFEKRFPHVRAVLEVQGRLGTKTHVFFSDASLKNLLQFLEKQEKAFGDLRKHSLKMWGDLYVFAASNFIVSSEEFKTFREMDKGEQVRYLQQRLKKDLLLPQNDPAISDAVILDIYDTLVPKSVGVSTGVASFRDLQVAIAEGNAVMRARAEGSLIAFQLEEDMLEGVSTMVVAKLMKGQGMQRVLSLKDQGEIRQSIHEVLQLEFNQKGIVIEPDVVAAAIQALPELTLTWSNARALVRGICETGLKRVR